MNNIDITRKTLDAFEVTLVGLDAILDCCGLVISKLAVRYPIPRSLAAG